MSTHDDNRLSTYHNPRLIVAWQKEREKTPTMSVTTNLVSTKHHGADSLTKNNLPDIIVAILNALGNAIATNLA